MATIEATWETWSPWGTNYCKEWDARTKAQTCGRWAKESWGTASAHLLEDMIGYKGKEGDFFIVESPAHSHLTKCSWGKHHSKQAHGHHASLDVMIHWMGHITELLWKYKTSSHLWKDSMQAQRDWAAFADRKRLGRMKPPKALWENPE